MNQILVRRYLNETIGISEKRHAKNIKPKYMYMQILIGCFKTFLSNFRSESNLRKNIHIAMKINGSVGKFMLIGVPDTNSDNSSDSGVQNNMMSNSLSNARNARKKRTSTKGISVTMNESLYIPNILAIM